jgi:hypothetical protein
MVRLGARVRLGWDVVLELARDEFSKPAIDNKDGDASKKSGVHGRYGYRRFRV